METIILHDGTTVKGIVEEQGFNGLFWCGQYWDRYGRQHHVTYHGNTWME